MSTTSSALMDVMDRMKAHLDKELAEKNARITELEAVVEKLPTLADGPVVVPPMTIWWVTDFNTVRERVVTCIDFIGDGWLLRNWKMNEGLCADAKRCYSTERAACDAAGGRLMTNEQMATAVREAAELIPRLYARITALEERVHLWHEAMNTTQINRAVANKRDAQARIAELEAKLADLVKEIDVRARREGGGIPYHMAHAYAAASDAGCGICAGPDCEGCATEPAARRGRGK